MPNKITTKWQMYQLLNQGTLGNTLRTWPTIQDLQNSGYTGQISIRTQTIGHPTEQYHVPANQAQQIINQNNITNPILTETPPDNHRTIQGEIMKAPWGIYLYYTHHQGPMRHALRKDPHHAQSLTALILLQKHIEEPTLTDIKELLNTYDPIIEFTTWDHTLGTIPGRQTIIWEVRNY